MGSAIRVAWVAAIAAAVFWGVKALVIWAAGGLDESSLESPLFGLGLVAIVIAYAALGLAVVRGRAVLVKVAAVLAAAAVGVAVALACDAIADAVLPSSTGWVEEEAGLWLSAAVTVAAVWWLRMRERPAAA